MFLLNDGAKLSSASLILFDGIEKVLAGVTSIQEVRAKTSS